VTYPARAGHGGSGSWTAARSSRWPAATHRAGSAVNPTAPSAWTSPSRLTSRHSGRWTPLPPPAQAQGIQVGRNQVRRILQAEGVRWRTVRSWSTSGDADFAPKGPRSSPSTPPRRHRPSWRLPVTPPCPCRSSQPLAGHGACGGRGSGQGSERGGSSVTPQGITQLRGVIRCTATESAPRVTSTRVVAGGGPART